MNEPELVPGRRYVHYKGGEYQVVALARHSETMEELVVYQALYGPMDMWVRPRVMFEELVEFDGALVRRFRPA